MKDIPHCHIIKLFSVRGCIRVSEKFMAHLLQTKKATSTAIVNKFLDVSKTKHSFHIKVFAMHALGINTQGFVNKIYLFLF